MTVSATDITPYLGRRCQVMVACPTCGGAHTHEGTLAPARGPGELQLDGQHFALNQIRALVPSQTDDDGDARSITVSARTFNLVLQAGLLLAALSALRVVFQ
jgi:hypothetical protein